MAMEMTSDRHELTAMGPSVPPERGPVDLVAAELAAADFLAALDVGGEQDGPASDGRTGEDRSDRRDRLENGRPGRGRAGSRCTASGRRELIVDDLRTRAYEIRPRSAASPIVDSRTRQGVYQSPRSADAGEPAGVWRRGVTRPSDGSTRWPWSARWLWAWPRRLPPCSAWSPWFVIAGSRWAGRRWPSSEPPARLAGPDLVMVANELLVRLVEEPHLRRVHGEEHDRYAAAVGRFVPGVGRLP